MSIFVYDTEGDGLLDEITQLHCAVFKELRKDNWFIFVDLEEFEKSRSGKLLTLNFTHKILDLTELSDWLNKVPTGLICHNQYGYDMPVFEKLGYIDSWHVAPDHINGRDVVLHDSLVWSRGLSPDRLLPQDCPARVYNVVEDKYQMVGAHGLMAWGYRVANKKPQVDDWRNQPLFVYVDRCIEDVKINELTWDELKKEASYHDNMIDWTSCLASTAAFEYRFGRQKDKGVAFDKDLGEELVVKCDKMMQELADNVEPQLPERLLPKSQQLTFPANPYNADGSLSANGWKYLAKIGYEVNLDALTKAKYPANPFLKKGGLSKTGEKFAEEYGLSTQEEVAQKISELRQANDVQPLEGEELEKALKDLKDGHVPVLYGTMHLSNQADIKEWLVTEGGWHPTIWGYKDITRDSKKQALTKEEMEEKAEDYLMNRFKDSPYRPFLQDMLGVKMGATKDVYLKAIYRSARQLPMSPKYKDDRGDICPNLDNLNHGLAKDVVKWLSLRSRRTTLLPLDDKKTTGWLNDERVLAEGRITASAMGYTNTYRLRHAGVRNVPKASEDVLLGKEFRQLFYAPKGTVFQTLDTSNMEALIGAWLAWSHDGGELYRVITGGGDTHAANAAAYSKAAGKEISRNDGKPITYGVMYGAQKAKVAGMLGISQDKAQKVINAYWDTNYGLKAVKEELEQYWEATGKKFVRAIDGRKLYTRSKHSLLNLLIQSTGAIMMNLAYIKVYDKLEQRGILEDSRPVIYYHDEVSFEVSRSLLKTFSFDTKEEAKDFKSEDMVLSEVKGVGEKFYRFYSPSGEAMQQAVNEASIELGAPFELTGEYAIGKDWSETH